MGGYVMEKGPVIRRGILLGLVGALPLLFLRPALDPFNVPKFAVLVFGLSIVLAIRVLELLQGADRSGLTRLIVPAGALIGPLLIAWLLAPYKAFELFGRQGRLQGLIPYAIVVLFGILLADAFGDSPRPIMWAFVLAGAGVASYSLIQYLQADPFGWILERRQTLSAVSTLGNPNFTGGFLGMVLPVAMVLWVITPKHRKPLGFLTIAVTGALIFTGSQGGWAAGLAGASIVAGFLARERIPRARLLGILGAVGVTVVTVGVVILGQLGVEQIPPTAAARGYWWRAAGEMSLQSPVIGRGPSAFAVEGVKYRVLEEAVKTGYTFPDDPHSVPFAFLAAAGILGAAGFIFVVAWGIRQGLAVPDEDLIGGAFLGLVVAYAVQSLVSIDEVMLRTSLWIGLAGLVCARVSFATSAKKRPEKTPKKAARNGRRSNAPRTKLRWAPAVAPLVLFVAAAGWWSFSFLSADIAMHEGVEAFGEDDVKAGREHMEEAISFRFETGYQRTLAGNLARVAADTKDPEMFEAADKEFSALDGWPDVATVVQHARLMRDWSEIDPNREADVMPLYRRALEIDPRNPILRLEVSEVLVLLEDPEGAEDLLEPVTDEVGPHLPAFWGMLALARAQTGDETGAQQAIEQALRLDPEEARALQARELIG
ncbi:MAG TPA: O-antigen ligase family protein [Actinomycetota bacterium]|nr:O-antigen ligase family protein [Actinomycetota bacterium]